eukprot:TRINITY_DN54768_c0_g1_i1.p1 TRINITY_DN54768_c0_g1~~TRINITY_DN54768_c0_g1_i1.p1  ORF type:complete len:293 (-),score=54.89 TRINITY_DN54768_c0_g1_i1:164-1042(-)
MDASLFQRFHPEEYYRRFLADGVRPDGRTPQERRHARCQRATLSAPLGSASIRLGHSAATAGVTAMVVESTPEQAAVGNIVVSVEFPPICAQVFRERSKARTVETFLSSSLTGIFNSEQILNPMQLNIRESEVAWVVRVDVVCLNFDGNAFDLCLLAALAALEDTALPALMNDATQDAGGVDAPAVQRLVEAPEGFDANSIVAAGRRIGLLSRPIPATFAQLPGECWVVDPCAAEEELGATVSLCIVGGRWLVYHLGGGADTERFLGELMPLANSYVSAITELLDGATEKRT